MGNRIKKWLQYNKALTISLIVVLVYTLIMAGIIFGLGFRLGRCSSGSVSEVETTVREIETTMHRP